MHWLCQNKELSILSRSDCMTTWWSMGQVWYGMVRPLTSQTRGCRDKDIYAHT